MYWIHTLFFYISSNFDIGTKSSLTLDDFYYNYYYFAKVSLCLSLLCITFHSPLSNSWLVTKVSFVTEINFLPQSCRKKARKVEKYECQELYVNLKLNIMNFETRQLKAAEGENIFPWYYESWLPFCFMSRIYFYNIFFLDLKKSEVSSY